MFLLWNCYNTILIISEKSGFDTQKSKLENLIYRPYREIKMQTILEKAYLEGRFTKDDLQFTIYQREFIMYDLRFVGGHS